MDIKVTPGLLHGTVTPPSSKSQCHREIICAALAQGESRLENVYFSDDINATLFGVSALGAKYIREADALRITGGTADTTPNIDCGASATTLRLLLPVALALYGEAVFKGVASLMSRPIEPYFRLFRERGIEYELNDNCLRVRGRLPAGKYVLPGDVSSQFFSGLLLALSLLDGESRMCAESPIQSRPYIDMTLDSMKRHGVGVTQGENEFIIPSQHYASCGCTVESDWSHAALWLAARELGNDISIHGMNENSVQGDRIFMEYLHALRGGGDAALDVSQCPDIVPPLALAAALRPGRCDITHAARLRYKECDRLDAVSCVLNALGADVVQREDGLIINGVPRLCGGAAVDCRNDHRIAMMAAAAATVCREPVIIRGAECVGKSYPDFWRVFRELGGAASAV